MFSFEQKKNIFLLKWSKFCILHRTHLF